MLTWFRPAPPVDPQAKAWIEQRLNWLMDEFESSAFTDRPLILPTHDCFPDPFDGSEDSVRVMCDRMCGYMGVPADVVDISFVSDAGKLWLVNEKGHYLPHAAGLYEEGIGRFRVRLDRSGLDDPMELAGTIAHELAHARLLGEGRISDDVFDNELLTDLTVVFMGLGIFLANAPLNWDSQYSVWPGTAHRRPEYMTLPMFGYALAHLAWHRGEPSPVWSKFLRPDARAVFRQSLRYLLKTGDSTFVPRAPRA